MCSWMFAFSYVCTSVVKTQKLNHCGILVCSSCLRCCSRALSPAAITRSLMRSRPIGQANDLCFESTESSISDSMAFSRSNSCRKHRISLRTSLRLGTSRLILLMRYNGQTNRVRHVLFVLALLLLAFLLIRASPSSSSWLSSLSGRNAGEGRARCC